MPLLTDIIMKVGAVLRTQPRSSYVYILLEAHSTAFMGPGKITRVYFHRATGALVYTTNAQWDTSTDNQWLSDYPTDPATKITLPSWVSGWKNSRFSYKTPASSWGEGSWTSYIQVGMDANNSLPALQLSGQLPQASVPDTNSLYGVSISRCWGNIGVSPGPTVTVNDSFNVDATLTVISGTILHVDFLTDLADANYCVVFGWYAATAGMLYVPRSQNEAAGGFDIAWYGSGDGGAKDINSFTTEVHFTVFGRQ